MSRLNQTPRSMPGRAASEVRFEPDRDLTAFAEALNFEPQRARALSGIGQTATTPIVIMSPDRQRFQSVDAQWGLVPRWHDGSLKNWSSNRRWTPIEEVTVDDPNDVQWLHYHCLVPIKGFSLLSFDGKHVVSASSRTLAPMAAAGLWRQYRQGGCDVTSFTVLTRAVPHSLAAFPEQEPILLGEADWWAWLVHQSLDDLQSSQSGEPQHFQLSATQPAFKLIEGRQ